MLLLSLNSYLLQVLTSVSTIHPWFQRSNSQSRVDSVSFPDLMPTSLPYDIVTIWSINAKVLHMPFDTILHITVLHSHLRLLLWFQRFQSSGTGLWIKIIVWQSFWLCLQMRTSICQSLFANLFSCNDNSTKWWLPQIMTRKSVLVGLEWFVSVQKYLLGVNYKSALTSTKQCSRYDSFALTSRNDFTTLVLCFQRILDYPGTNNAYQIPEIPVCW